MSAGPQLFRVDAFSARAGAGNPAGVVLGADALEPAQYRALAQQLGAADVAFVLEPDADDHDLRVRFLTPRGEAPFIGHATLAVHAVLAALQLPPRRRQRSAAGIVEIDTLAATPPRIAVHLPPPTLGAGLAAEQLESVLAALGLERGDLDPRCTPRIAGTSGTRLLLGVRDARALHGARPQHAALVALSAQLGAPGYFLYTLRPAQPDVYTEARMFCPALGIPEDPVSGNAHALLGALLLHQGLLAAPAGAGPAAHEVLEFTGAQGSDVQRPGQVTVALALSAGTLRAVSIIGEAVVDPGDLARAAMALNCATVLP